MSIARPLPQPPAAGEVTATGILALATDALRARRWAEVEELRLAIGWAVVHGHPRDERDPMVTPGGDGTPQVREHAIPELAMARETHAATTRALIADGLDLIHRMPRTWAVVEAGGCEPWVARKAAVIARSLLSEQVVVVDRAVARAIAGHAPSTVLEIARAKVIDADPQTHRTERERSRHERYVSLSRSDEFGYRCVIARVTAGDAAWIDATVDRVADILAQTMGADHNRDELRSLALGWLARPADLLKLLLDHTDQPTDDEHTDEPTDKTTDEPVEGEPTDETTDEHADGPADGDEPTDEHTDEATDDNRRPVWAPGHLADTLDRLAAMSARQLARMRGRGRLFVHLTDDAIRTGTGLARIEGVGPIDVAQLREVLGHADVTVTPVLDLRMRRRVDAYEHPETVKDHVWTQTGGDCFPYTPRTATRDGVDYDHAIPYDDTGPPGQTGPHNSGPLRRRHHRTKTHGGLTTRVVGPGRHLWQTPHGQACLVDHTGTHRISPHEADAMTEAIDDGIELYFTMPLSYTPA